LHRLQLRIAMLSEVQSPSDTQPITRELMGPEAWKRAELREQDWRVVFDAAAQAEILEVAATLRQQPVPLLALRPDSFDMPACRAAMARVSQILKRGVRFALAERLPVEKLSEEEARCIYWMLSSMVARPVAQKLDGTMIYDVTDTGKKPLPGSGLRPDKCNVDLQFHNDNAYNFLMPEIVGLLCIRKAATGGQSRVMSFATAHNALRERFPEALQRLYRPFWFDRQREHRPDEEPLFAAPIFVNDGGKLRARLGQHQIRNGYALKGAMDRETEAAIKAIDTVFTDSDLQYEFDMQPGDMQFAMNCEVGHSRTEFRDSGDVAQKRLLVRLWLRDRGAPGYIG
jgi:hypothetical protein